MKNVLKSLICLSIVLASYSCSSDDDNPASVDHRKFTTSAVNNFFINQDGTVNLTIPSKTNSDANNEETEKGFVYGTTTEPKVNGSNTSTTLLGDPNGTTIYNLEAGKTYYVRGYFKMADGTFFYGNQIEASTTVDASSSRAIVMVMEQEEFFKNHNSITPKLNVTSVVKESPIAIGFEYSLNSDFSNSTILVYQKLTGNVRVTSYTEVIENLTPSTTYYIKPYAKYADGTVTNGGTSTASITTSKEI